MIEDEEIVLSPEILGYNEVTTRSGAKRILRDHLLAIDKRTACARCFHTFRSKRQLLQHIRSTKHKVSSSVVTREFRMTHDLTTLLRVVCLEQFFW